MADLVHVARELGPSIAERSERIEATRTLPDDVVHDLCSAGLFRFFVYRDLGLSHGRGSLLGRVSGLSRG